MALVRSGVWVRTWRRHVWLTLRHLGIIGTRHFGLRCDGHSRTGALQAVYDNRFARLQAGTNEPLAVNDGPELYRLINDRVRRGEREYVLLRLIGANGAL